MKKFRVFGLRSPIPHVHTESMQVTAHPTSVFGQKALNFQNGNASGLKDALETAYGIYIFYDSRGHSIYVGKAREQTIWKEMNLAFNRQREVQTIALVHHPERNQAFKPGYEKLRQPKDTQLELFDMAHYFSAYSVDDGMIDDLEALMVRGFANDLLNVKMETFAHSRE